MKLENFNLKGRSEGGVMKEYYYKSNEYLEHVGIAKGYPLFDKILILVASHKKAEKNLALHKKALELAGEIIVKCSKCKDALRTATSNPKGVVNTLIAYAKEQIDETRD
jgi:hypothetical protein